MSHIGCIGEGCPICARLQKPGWDKVVDALKVGAQIVNATVTHIADGFSRVTDEELKQRLYICGQCEFLKDSRCTQCSCFVNIKAAWKTQDCPKGRWPQNKDSKASGCCGG